MESTVLILELGLSSSTALLIRTLYLRQQATRDEAVKYTFVNWLIVCSIFYPGLDFVIREALPFIIMAFATYRILRLKDKKYNNVD